MYREYRYRNYIGRCKGIEYRFVYSFEIFVSVEVIPISCTVKCGVYWYIAPQDVTNY